ncbi:MAG: carboxylesterase family protein [Gammaproteobacteria bacterium]|nr:carboxylesterase family protein [Gammaproteobacteria bacterium]
MEIESGRLRGRLSHNVLRFDGIPYAAPPLGELRFAAPQPAPPWSGVRSAVHPPPGPLQLPGQTLGSRPVAVTSEDCLHVNVVTPSLEGRRAVMVWIYGGGFINGASADPIHAGERLAARGDVVLVTFDYRLGVFGFLHSEVGSNAGMRDQLAALAWVQRNIEAFGGDPDRVTVFGESAGAMCLLTLMGMPAADGLFRAGIAQSGAASWISDQDSAARTQAALAELLGSEDVRQWRTLPAERLLAAQQAVEERIRASTGRGAFRPLLDGDLIVVDGHDAQSREVNRQRSLIVGSNGDEQRLFLILRRKLDHSTAAARLSRALSSRCRDPHAAAVALLDGYARLRPDAPVVELLAAAETELYYRRPLLGLAAAREQQRATTWNYLFTWPSPALRGRLGACHALEIPFVFGTLDAPGMASFAGDSPQAWRVSEQVMDAWAAFAQDGHPNAVVPAWVPWSSRDHWAWIIDEEAGVERDPRAAERSLWAEALDR